MAARRKLWLGIVLLALGIALFLFLNLQDVSDADSFYHIRHAWLYRTQGIFQSAFPWVQFSAISQYSSDIWYGFHILLIPLTLFADLAVGIKIGGILVTALSLILIGFAFMRLRIRWPLFWLFLLIFITADLAYRFSMLRPHPISLGLALLIFAYLFKSDEEKRSSRKASLILIGLSALYSWNHLSLFWLPLLIALVVAAIQFIQERKIYWMNSLAVLGGLILGWLLRPNPLGAAKLAYIQVFKLLFEKQGGLPLRFGRELTPFVFENFVDQLIPITILIAVAVIFFVWLLANRRSFHWKLPEKIKAPIWSSLVLAAIFFYLTFAVARRSNEIFISFAVIFIALLFSHYLNVMQARRHKLLSSKISIFLALLMLIIVIYSPIKTTYRFNTYARVYFTADRFEEVAKWLKENTESGEIVFNIQWDRFAQLFYVNQHNYYINGMDPIFEYAYSPELYWKTHFLAINEATAYTCAKIRCEKDEVELTHAVLKSDFNASFILVEKNRNPKLLEYLNLDTSRFERVLETERDLLFKII